ncbi:hypothetical protein [Latilactobacillus graminis]|nr:hypothetical protein [Latilactobacillus graminis]
MHELVDSVGNAITKQFNKTAKEDEKNPGYTIPKINGGYQFVSTK